MALNHFLLIYNVQLQRLAEPPREFGENAELATRCYGEVEREYRDRRDSAHFEIVLIGADSIETIRKTHAHYFADPDGAPFDVDELVPA